MNKIEKIQIPNIKDTSLLVVLDSIELEKTLGYHDLFLLWSPTFQKAGIPVYIVKIPLTSQISFGNINERKRVCNEKNMEV